jgi:hypothetical protein
MTIIAEGYTHDITCERCGADGKRHSTEPPSPDEIIICGRCVEILCDQLSMSGEQVLEFVNSDTARKILHN